MSERENGWYLRSDGYMTSECSYQRIDAMKGNMALDNHGRLVFIKYMGGKEADSRVYLPHPGTCEIETCERWFPAGCYHRCKNCGAFFAVMDASSDILPYVCPNCGKAVKR